MGLFKGNVAMSVFNVAPHEGEPDSTVDDLGEGTFFRSTYGTHAWDERLPRRDGVKRGWVSTLDPTEADVQTLNPYILAFTLREDKISINSTYKKIAIRQAEQNSMESRGVHKLGRSERKEIKDAVLEDLERRALPSVQLIDLAYVPKTRRLYVFSTSLPQIDLVVRYFADCFNVHVSPVESDLGEHARDHLLWLWMNAGQPLGTLSIELEERMTLAHAGTGEKMIVVGEKPGDNPDASYGLLRGKLPSELRFVLTVADQDFKVALSATEVGINITRLAVPKSSGSTPEEVLDERVSLCMLALEALADLEKQSETDRNAPGWEARAATWIESLPRPE